MSLLTRGIPDPGTLEPTVVLAGREESDVVLGDGPGEHGWVVGACLRSTDDGDGGWRG